MTGPAAGSGFNVTDAAAGVAQPHALAVPQAVQLAPTLWGLGTSTHNL